MGGDELFFIESTPVFYESPALDCSGLSDHAADDEIRPKRHGVNAVELTCLGWVVWMRVVDAEDIEAVFFGDFFCVQQRSGIGEHGVDEAIGRRRAILEFYKRPEPVPQALQRGQAALTGPVARGDAAAVAGHLQAFDEVSPDLARAYRTNSWRTAQRAHAPDAVFEVLAEAGQS